MKTSFYKGQLSHGPRYVLSQVNFLLSGICAILLFCCLSTSYAQNCNVAVHNLQDFTYSVSTDAEGDILISCHLGTVGQPVNDLLGMQVSFDLGVTQNAETKASVDFTGGWLEGDGNYQGSVNLNNEDDVIELTWERNDCAPQSGQGLVAVIKLKDPALPDNLSTLVNTVDGIVMVENLPVTKMFTAEEVEPQIQVGPNPASDYVHIWDADLDRYGSNFDW